MTMSPAIVEALSIAQLPDVDWSLGDDLCDCTFQRIGHWTNPYLAETLEIRLCCVWAELAKMFPGYVRQIPGFWNENEQEWETEPWQWDGETDMPRYLWYRQLARQQDKPLTQIRAEYGESDTPKGKPRKPAPILFLPWSGDWLPLELG